MPTAAQLIAAGRALGPVGGSLVIPAARIGGQGFQEFNFTLAAAGSVNSAYVVTAIADFCWICNLTPNNAVIEVGPIGRGSITVDTEKVLMRYSGGFQNLQVQNRNAFAVTVKLIIGTGEYWELGHSSVSYLTAGGLVSEVSAANPLPVSIGNPGGALTAVTAVEGLRAVAAIGVPEALDAANPTLYRVIDIKALLTNTQDLFYGFSAANSTQMWRLTPGEWKSLRFPEGKGCAPASIFIDVNVGGEGVAWNAFL